MLEMNQKSAQIPENTLEQEKPERKKYLLIGRFFLF